MIDPFLYLTVQPDLVGTATDHTGWEHYQWRITLTLSDWPSGPSMHFDYQMGKRLVDLRGDPLSPNPREALASFISDVVFIDSFSFEEWCEQWEFDSDSRRAEGIYNRCHDLSGQFNELLSWQWPNVLDDRLRGLVEWAASLDPSAEVLLDVRPHLRSVP